LFFMTAWFVVLAVLMVLIALGIILIPMLRSARSHGRPRHVFVTAVAVLFALPLVAWGLYMHVGTPAALNPSALHPPPMTLDQAVVKLKGELAKHPDNLQGWLLLGQTYAGTNRDSLAREAYGHALKLAPSNADIMVAWAEADSMAQADHHVSDRGRTLLEQAVKADPRNQRGLWLLGISNFQHGQFADAVLLWRRLKVLLEPGSKVAQAVDQQIAVANARASGKTEAQALEIARNAPAPASTTVQPDNEGAHIAVKVSLAPALKGRVKPGDTLYVFAKALKGPPMPLAVARLKASSLPTTVMLTDGMGMTPTLRLSSVTRVNLTARISHSGQPVAAPGDLEGTTGPVSVDAGKPVSIVIDSVH
jgi:cytochrome c-type biogenesis protein CcmH